MLFTDIEGSTWLLQRLGEGYNDLLEQHHAIMRRVIQAHGGREVDTQGDAFFVVFSDPRNALDAAVTAQRDLTSQGWPGGLPIWLRMGLHTGEPALGTTGYVGLDVHRAARIAACGHGGQVLLSKETATLAGRTLPEGVTLRDLGTHRLKDLEQPERLFQVVAADLRSTFPPIKSLDSRPNNLPAQRTPMIGREREVSDVMELLRAEGVRLLTLTGPGGTGKTRLALQAALELLDDFTDGVFMVPLAGVAEAGRVPEAMASSLGLHPSGPARITDNITRYLRDKELLLVVDNFEHVVTAAPILVEVLDSCSGVKVMVTSRVVLKVSGEQHFQVSPLQLPDPKSFRSPDDLLAAESVSLFVDRARAVKADFALTQQNAAAVAELSVRLDGLPLAIELAASRVRLLSPQSLLRRLESRLRLLTGGGRDAPARQKTMRGAIAWSHGLLTERERVLFRRLSVFAGGCDLESVEAVCSEPGGDDLDVLESLTSLLESSLLQRLPEENRENGVMMLETIREFAGEQLREDGEESLIRDAHLRYFAERAQQMAPMLGTTEVRAAMRWFGREVENLQGALDHATKTGAPAAGVLREALRSFRRHRGYWMSW